MPNKSLHQSAKQMFSYSACMFNSTSSLASFTFGELRR
jgi:hypothetical protein